MLAGAVVALNFKFRYASFFSDLTFSSTFLPTKSAVCCNCVFNFCRECFFKFAYKKTESVARTRKRRQSKVKGKTFSACGAECDGDAQFCRICGNGFNNEESFFVRIAEKSVSPSAVFLQLLR
ncbi:MAG: hypothetical protein L6V93_14610 [Clostridiales bacterium]|nr:MAG: hypothetical protein L6V93_14610 [Clostridiales bacterium]